MTPREYVEERKRERPVTEIQLDSIEKLPKKIKEQGAGTDIDMQALLASVNKMDYASHLLERLLPRLPPVVRDLFDVGKVAVGTVQDSAPNAFTTSIDPEGFAIIFHSGLRDFVFRVARIVATHFIPASDGKPLGTSPEIVDTARRIAEVFWWCQETGAAFGPAYPIADYQVKLASMLATECETFLLAHEIGHVLDELSNHGHPFFAEIGEEPPFHIREEHYADLLGLWIVMELHNENAVRDPFLTPLVYAGAEFALQLYRCLELVGLPIGGTHPAAGDRVVRLRELMAKRCEDTATWEAISAMAIGIEQLFEQIMDLLGDPCEHDAYFRREAAAAIDELTKLLQDCSEEPVPKYSSFYSAAGAIFDRGYPEVMLEEVSRLSAAFASALESGLAGIEPPAPEAFVRVNQYKLLLGFFTNLPESAPMRSVFINALTSR